MTIVKIIAGILLLVIVAQAYVRLAPLPKDRLTAKPGPDEPGVHPLKGGIKIVRPLAEMPADAVAGLIAIAGATPRSVRIGGADNPATFVTRSRLWGFPDIALIWTDGANLHLHSHLVFGQSDLGVNAARAGRWLAALDAQ